MQIVIINTHVAQERRAFQKAQMQGLGLDYTILPAVSTDDLSKDVYKKHEYDWQRRLKHTEIACYYSHRKAWQQVTEQQQPMLILEDDALLSQTTPDILQSLETQRGLDIVTLEIRNRKKYVGKTSRKITREHDLIRLYQDRTGAAAYVLWPTGAEKLLALEKNKGIALADAHITSCNDLQAYQIEPAAAIQLDQCVTYHIATDTDVKLSYSTVSSTTKPKKEIVFLYKRLTHQLLLGIRQCVLLLTAKAKKRFIRIDPSQF